MQLSRTANSQEALSETSMGLPMSEKSQVLDTEIDTGNSDDLAVLMSQILASPLGLNGVMHVWPTRLAVALWTWVASLAISLSQAVIIQSNQKVSFCSDLNGRICHLLPPRALPEGTGCVMETQRCEAGFRRPEFHRGPVPAPARATSPPNRR